MKQFVAYGIIASIVLALGTGFMEPANEDGWYSLAGLGFLVFGIWSSVLLLKKEKTNVEIKKID